MNQGKNAKAVISLIDLGTITTVLIPLLYTAGWSFAYHYFQHFHLGMQGLNIQKEYLFLYSFWVLKTTGLFLRPLSCLWLSYIWAFVYTFENQ